ncbi:MAG: flagellar basal body rod protein FlgB [Gammaproteobacteria bacterium]|nr:flagellar basal body rod protein FlgB [Gammaproteobacteria bacterium]
MAVAITSLDKRGIEHMAISMDKVFGIHENAMHLQGHRAKLISQNLANSDTPGYKAKDIDFKSAMKSAANGTLQTPLKATQGGHIQPKDYFMGSDQLYRQPMQSSLDGNTVEPHVEMSEFTENSMRYLMTLRIMSGRINGMLTALRGE